MNESQILPDSPSQDPGRRPTQKNDGSIASFVRAHNRALSFAGALIVFSTFIVKEGFREHLKDLTDTIGSAKINYSMQRRFDSIEESLNSIKDDLDLLRYDMKEGSNSPTRIELARRINSLESLSFKIATDIQLSCGNLLLKIPANDAIKLRFIDLSKELEDAKKQWETSRILSEQASNSKTLGELKERVLKSLAAPPPPAIGNDSSMKKFSFYMDNLLKVADDAHEKSEFHYRICTWVSWALYTLGWGLGLIGRLYKVEMLGAE